MANTNKDVIKSFEQLTIANDDAERSVTLTERQLHHCEERKSEPVIQISGEGCDASASVQTTSPDRPLPTVRCSVRIGTWNIRSLGKKFVAVADTILFRGLDLLLMTESWHISDAEIRCSPPRGYAFVHCPRPGVTAHTRGGGIVVYHRDTLPVRRIPITPVLPTTFEVLAVTVLSPHEPLTVITIYRPKPKPEFFKELTSLLEQFAQYNTQIVIAGDLNIHLENPKLTDTKTFGDIMKRFGLVQHVDKPTHKDGGWLDVFITRDDTSLIDIHIDRPTKSDHGLVVATVGLNLVHVEEVEFVREVTGSNNKRQRRGVNVPSKLRHCAAAQSENPGRAEDFSAAQKNQFEDIIAAGQDDVDSRSSTSSVRLPSGSSGLLANCQATPVGVATNNYYLHIDTSGDPGIGKIISFMTKYDASDPRHDTNKGKKSYSHVLWKVPDAFSFTEIETKMTELTEKKPGSKINITKIKDNEHEKHTFPKPASEFTQRTSTSTQTSYVRTLLLDCLVPRRERGNRDDPYPAP